jgi:methionyl-tRNA formyltransferase
VTLRVLFFGMEGTLSRAPLLALKEALFDVCAVVVPRPVQSQNAHDPLRLIAPPRAPESDVPLLYEPRDMNIIGIAWNTGIDVYETDNLKNQKTVERLTALEPDVICVACFPYLLPKSLTHSPSIKYALNLHPSLLPAYRGPAPLFWIFHDGLEQAGVTIHLVESSADTGDIIAQERASLPDGVRYGAAERILSEQSARMLVRAMHAIESGTIARTPQVETSAPRAPSPTDRDFVITTEWSARRAFNFIRGIADWNHPVTCITANERLVILDAISFDERRTTNADSSPEGSTFQIKFGTGTLTCVLVK